MDSNITTFAKSEDVDFQHFVDQWAVNPDCGLTRWSRSQGHVSMKEGVGNFYRLAERSPEHARWVHYHVGWIFDQEIRMDLIRFAAKESSQAFLLWLQDATLTTEQDAVLEASFRDPKTGCPGLVEAFDSGQVRRVKGMEPQQFNETSEVVRELRARGWI